MDVVWGVILLAFSLLAWLGQAISMLAPNRAASWGLTEKESAVDPAYFADVRGEAVWDTFILWTLPAAGFLLVLNNPLWAFFGLVGGGMYLYFAGRGIAVRLNMQKRGIRIGSRSSIMIAYLFLSLWGLIAVVTIVLAIVALQ